MYVTTYEIIIIIIYIARAKNKSNFSRTKKDLSGGQEIDSGGRGAKNNVQYSTPSSSSYLSYTCIIRPLNCVILFFIFHITVPKSLSYCAIRGKREKKEVIEPCSDFSEEITSQLPTQSLRVCTAVLNK